MLLSKLISKDVVNVSNGEKLGKIRDMEIDLENGKIKFLVVSAVQPISSLLKKHKIQVEFQNIEKIGESVILVKREL